MIIQINDDNLKSTAINLNIQYRLNLKYLFKPTITFQI